MRSSARKGFTQVWWFASALLVLIIWVGYTIIQGNQAHRDMQEAKEALIQLEALVQELSHNKEGQNQMNDSSNSVAISSGGGDGDGGVKSSVITTEKAPASTSSYVSLSTAHHPSNEHKTLKDMSQSDTLGSIMRQPSRSRGSDNAVVKVSSDSSPDRKCSIAKVNTYVNSRSQDLGLHKVPFKIVDPKSKDSNVMQVNDFPCPETEMHACACQVKCKDEQCSKAVDLCFKYNQEDFSSISEYACGAISISEGSVWATLKRLPSSYEDKLLTLRELNFDSSMKVISEVAAEVPSRLPRPPVLSSSVTSILSKTIGDSLGQVALQLRPYLGPNANQGTSPKEEKWKPGGFCAGGPVQHKVLAPSTEFDSYSSIYGGVGAIRDPFEGKQWEQFLSKKIGLIALSMKSPASLANSMFSWQASGMLNYMSEKLAFLSEPMPAELAIAKFYDFKVWQPQMFKDARKSADNRFTIGSAFYYAMQVSKCDYLLFLEKDFSVDSALTSRQVAEEILTSAWMLNQGAMIVRLRTRNDMGCGGFRNCAGNKPDWKGATTRARRRNWFSFYCESPASSTVMADCVKPSESDTQAVPWYRCFSSFDSNWSLNAAFINRKGALQTLIDPSAGNGKNWSFGSLASYGESKYDDQAGFERGMLTDDWGKLKVPLCLSYYGVFKHDEIDL